MTEGMHLVERRSSVRANVSAIGVMAMCLGFAVFWAQGPRDGRGVLGRAAAGGTLWAADVESGADHITPSALVAALQSDPGELLLIDVRPAAEYAAFHLPGAHSLDLPALLGAEGATLLAAHADRPVILYSNGMVHPAQAWAELASRGFTNIRVLEGGLMQLRDEVLTPPSLRPGHDEARARRELAAFRSAETLLRSSASR